MRDVILCLMMFTLVAWVAGCADTSVCAPGERLVDGECVDAPNGGVPQPITKELSFFCEFAPLDTFDEPNTFDAQLTVAPTEAIVGDEAFKAELEGLAIFSDVFLNAGQIIIGGYKRIGLVDVHATVHVREGADGDDVRLDARSTTPDAEETCTFDAAGKSGSDAGPFPTCSLSNDNPDGSNPDCTGLGGEESPANPCLRYVTITISDDCAPDGECAQLGWTGVGSPCDLIGFCVTEPFEIELGTDEPALYTAASSGRVAFGWDDQSTGAEEITEGPNKGAWQLPPADLGSPAGPNAVRVMVNGFLLGFECTMAVWSRGPDGVGSRDPLASRTPDYLLIRFPIE